MHELLEPDILTTVLNLGHTHNGVSNWDTTKRRCGARPERRGASPRTKRRREPDRWPASVPEPVDRCVSKHTAHCSLLTPSPGTAAVAQGGIWILAAIVWGAILSQKLIFFSAHPVRSHFPLIKQC